MMEQAAARRYEMINENPRPLTGTGGVTDPPASDYGAARNKTNLLPLTTEQQQGQTA